VEEILKTHGRKRIDLAIAATNERLRLDVLPSEFSREDKPSAFENQISEHGNVWGSALTGVRPDFDCNIE
jgi:hypothetical protein